MTWIDRVEKLGRLVLWLTISSVFVMVPLAVIGQYRTEAQQKEDARKAEESLAKLKAESRPSRLALESMGMFLSGLSQSNAEAKAWVTNVSPISGFLCLRGVVTNTSTRASTKSMATCEAVGAYGSAQLTMMFAGANLRDLCKSGECELGVEDAPNAPGTTPVGVTAALTPAAK